MSHAAPLIVILGPTASGKSGLALELGQSQPSTIFCADSRQIYAEMDIGTAKPTQAEQNLVPHELLNLVSPDATMNVASYKEVAVRSIQALRKKNPNVLPFLVGGTMQYIDAVCDNWIIPNVPPNEELRKVMDAEELPTLQARLQTMDPETYAAIDLNNKRKVIRALELIHTAGLNPTRARRRGKPIFNVLKIGVSRDREEVYSRINQRVITMVEQGLIEEVGTLVEKYGWDAPGLSAVGYIQWRPYFEGTASKEECIANIQQATRHYAKRQLTWWRKDNTIKWVRNHSEAMSLITGFLSSNA